MIRQIHRRSEGAFQAATARQQKQKEHLRQTSPQLSHRLTWERAKRRPLSEMSITEDAGAFVSKLEHRRAMSFLSLSFLAVDSSDQTHLFSREQVE
jgi:hypothetical protein